ncbi:MAG: rhodanese-related sulfurtransferase [Woeseiaceae bacterium]
MTTSVQVVSFYRFTTVSDVQALGESVRREADARSLLGTAIIAKEGLNATFSGEKLDLDSLLDWLREQPGFEGIDGRWSLTDAPPFRRLRIKYRDEIVSMGHAEVNPANGQGLHVGAEDWNQLIDDPETLVIDTRNLYEIEIGTFDRAVNPETRNFREFSDYIDNELADDPDRPIAMFCTGGIRCEKATAVMRDKGFSQLYQLRGGVLGYLDEIAGDQALESRWQGECFVFDSRVAVDDTLSPGGYVQCHGCRRALSDTDLAHDDYEPGICCAKCVGQLTEVQRRQFLERRNQVALAEARGETHIGAVYPAKDEFRR